MADRVTDAVAKMMAALDGLTERECVMVIVQLRTEIARKKWGDDAGQKLDESHHRVHAQSGRVPPVAIVAALAMSGALYDARRCTKCWEVHGAGAPCLEPPTIVLSDEMLERGRG